MKDLFDLKGNVAIVTGASSGLGVQFAKALANQGADLAIIARREEKLKEVKEKIEKDFGVRVNYYPQDLTEFDQIPGLVSKIKDDFGKIDILVNNAGLSIAHNAKDYPTKDFQKMMDINVNAVFAMAREVGNVMIEKNYGRIINIGSVHSRVSIGFDYISAYTTSKFAVRGLTTALATEWAKYGITVNAIGPAYFESEMTEGMLDSPVFKNIVDSTCPMKRIGKKHELDTTLVYLASRYSSYVTGELIGVDGGWTNL